MRKLLILFLPIFIISCDKIGGNSLKGWYTDLDKVATTYGFAKIDEAIANYECIYSLGSHYDPDHSSDRYATRDLFFHDNGRWTSSSAYYGTCRFLPEVGQQIFVVQIVNENTLTYYYGWLYDPDYVPSSEILGKVYAGRNIGELVYYDESPRTYTYTELDNKLYVSNGDIFTVSSTGLIKDGTNGIMSKYNPSTRF